MLTPAQLDTLDTLAAAGFVFAGFTAGGEALAALPRSLGCGVKSLRIDAAGAARTR